MNDVANVSRPIWFWAFAAVALIWNLMGVAAFFMHMTITPEALLAMPEAERALYQSVPLWATGAFAVAVLGGAIGCLLLLLKSRWALHALIASLIGVIVQMAYNFFLSNTFEVYGPGGMIMPILVLGVAVFLVWFAKVSIARKWIG